MSHLEKHTSFPDPDCCPVVDGVLLVVDHGIVPDKGQVPLKLPHVVVLVRLHLLAHGAEIHRVLDDVQVVRDLGNNERHKQRRKNKQTMATNSSHEGLQKWDVTKFE